MQKINSKKSFFYASILLLSLTFSACGGKKATDTTTTPAEQKSTAINCDLWTKNQMFMSASYGIAQSKGDKIFINKLSIMQLISSLELQSDPELDKIKSNLLDKLEHAPANQDPMYTIEFTQDAISLRDRLSLGIQSYIEKCQK